MTTTKSTTSGSAKDMIEGLRKQVDEAKKFQAAVDKLRAAGLNDTSLQNLLNDFISTGDSTIAGNLAAGGKSAVDEVNALMKQMASVTGSETSGWAKDIANDLFDAGCGRPAHHDQEAAGDQVPVT